MDEVYSKLKPITSFTDIFEQEYYRDPPMDWYVIITDVVSSTIAIQSGKYKEVNTAGSLAVMAITNVTGDMQFPFIFGGDGMTYLLPPDLIDQVKDLLVDTRDLVKKIFDLDLRLGFVKVQEIYDLGSQVHLARLQVSPRYTQAIISGPGIDLAEKLIKDPDPNNPYLVPQDVEPKGIADFSGFTCRWEDIPSSYGETISIIVKSREESMEASGKLLRTLITSIEKIFGREETYHPLKMENQAMGRAEVSKEARVMSGKKGGIGYAFRTLAIRMEVAAVKLVERLNIPVRRGKKYFKDVKMDNMINSDFRKFDGTLKMVLSCHTAQRERFERLLGALYENGKLFYGVHVSDRALMTCMVHFGSDEEVHFIDAADGGYASAALKLKQQIKKIG